MTTLISRSSSYWSKHIESNALLNLHQSSPIKRDQFLGVKVVSQTVVSNEDTKHHLSWRNKSRLKDSTSLTTNAQDGGHHYSKHVESPKLWAMNSFGAASAVSKGGCILAVTPVFTSAVGDAVEFWLGMTLETPAFRPISVLFSPLSECCDILASAIRWAPLSAMDGSKILTAFEEH